MALIQSLTISGNQNVCGSLLPGNGYVNIQPATRDPYVNDYSFSITSKNFLLIGDKPMQINLTGHHMDITPALRAYIDNKFERLERHFDNMTNVHVILSVEKERQKAEAKIHVNKGNIFADSEHEDMYAAIDTLIDKLDRQVKKYKEKRTNHRRYEGNSRGEGAS